MEDLGMFVQSEIPYKKGAQIKVIGVGGAGGNAISNMIQANLGDVEYIAVNTDIQALETTGANSQILISPLGLGAGGKPEKGRQFALDSIDEIRNNIKGADMIFLTCGLGGGTGTGATPVIAAEAQASNILTVAVVSVPHTAAGRVRNNIAKEGLAELIKYVDSYIIVPNDGMQDAGHKQTFKEALKMADDVLRQSIQGIVEISDKKGHINIDFADITTAMSGKGKAVMGVGTASGEDRAKKAFYNALSSPLLADTNIKGAHSVLLNISGREDDLLMDEVAEIQNMVYEHAGEDAHIIEGVRYDNREEDSISVTIVATGIVESNKIDNVSKIKEIESAKPTKTIVYNMQDKMKHIVDNDNNLQGLDSLKYEYYEIPTFMRKESD